MSHATSGDRVAASAMLAAGKHTAGSANSTSEPVLPAKRFRNLD